MTADRFESQRPPGAPVHVVPAPQADASLATATHPPDPRHPRHPPHPPHVRSGRAWLLLMGNAVAAYAILAIVLPSPWGILVPIAALTQVAIARRGATATLVVATLGCAAGGTLAAVRASHGVAGDPVRMVCAGILVGMAALAAWPRSDASRERSGRPG